ncbi:5343_t:CDS:2 [Entrophospora sp. SA101]|nr:18688_t:CDS:2 [Entrophospora sp. SA101]CAJ0755745.1 7283_t:CDS:2 [Entrophospora sp. SA101]CAJ0760635.1 1302_t:CDS:2 [Entrophospora sp. SA101]CAJ0767591.1 5343_t:CDS:2 [Entrophospora sp. SA101]
MGAKPSSLGKRKNKEKAVTNSNQQSSSETMISYYENRKYLVCTEEITDILPVDDDDEFARTNTIHFLHKKIWDETNFSAPITKQLENGYGFDVLDVGPNNVNFLLGNIITGLNIKSNTFDYVFMRYMKTSIQINDWSKAIGEMIRVAKPNGWLELIEMDDMFTNGSPECLELMDKVEKRLKNKYNLTNSPFKLINNILLKEYFNIITDVQFFKKTIPMSGHWDNDSDNIIAKVSYDTAYWGSKSYKHSLDCLDLTHDEYDKYVEKAFESIKNRRCTYSLCRSIARKI